MGVVIPLRPPNGYGEIVQAFGDPRFDGSTVDHDWEETNMVMVPDIYPGARRLYCNKAIVEPLRAAFAACLALGDGYEIKRVGCFAPRFQRGSSSLVSIHTFGAAIDLNPDQNPLIIPKPYNPAPVRGVDFDIPEAWINAFRAQGFFWGGDFQRRFDAMHFQMATGY